MTAAARPVTPVGILAQLLARLADSAPVLRDAPPDFVPELLRARDLAAGLDPYLEANTTPESPALAELVRRTQAEDWTRRTGGLEQEMLSGHVEGQTLRFLVQMTKAVRVLEIGMFTGYSALAMAEALPIDGRVVACELDESVAEFAGSCFAASPAGGRIDVRVGPAQHTLKELAAAGEVFDLVFLDADKAGYLAYLRTVLDEGLLAEGGTVCVDNTLMQGEPWLGRELSPNGAAIAAFNRAVTEDERLEHVLLPLRDGLTLIRRR